MNIHYKNKEEQEAMRVGGKMLSETLWEVMKAIKPGVSELEIDALAEKLIREKGGEPGFQKVHGYKHTICACTNEVVVHGIPRADYRFKPGDMVCIDCGVYYKGFHTDMAETILVPGEEGDKRANNSPRHSGKPKAHPESEVGSWTASNAAAASQDDKLKFLENGKRALEAGVAQAVNGNRIGHISKAIQDIVEKEGGYSIVRSLIGHGVGRQLHEDPEVPGYLNRKIDKTPLLKEGMTIAIEVIYNMGKPDVVYTGGDDWTIESADGSLSAVFERSVLITRDQPEILTP